MRLLAIDKTRFGHAFGRDVEFHNACRQSAYLDRASGEIFWVYEEDEHAYMEAGISPKENAEDRQRFAGDPDQYLEIPGLDHGDHHEILQEFLASDWTEDAEAKSRARCAYSTSIGGWKKAVADESIVYAFYEFRVRRIEQTAEAFLREHAIEPQWR